MKIQLDYDSKTIRLEKRVKLGKFFDTIEKILPKWKDWKLDTTSEIVWKNPIYIERPYYHRTWFVGDMLLDAGNDLTWESNSGSLTASKTMFSATPTDVVFGDRNHPTALPLSTNNDVTGGVYCLDVVDQLTEPLPEDA